MGPACVIYGKAGQVDQVRIEVVAQKHQYE